MDRVQTPCIVCKAIIYASDNRPESAVCASCKRLGKAPKKERFGKCSKCKINITKDRISLRPGLCLFCYGRMIQSEQEQEAAAAAKAIMPAVVCETGDIAVTGTVMFGDFPWQHANVCPVG